MKTRIRPGHIAPLRNLVISFRELRYRLAWAKARNADTAAAVERHGKGAVIKTPDELRREIREKNLRELLRLLERTEKRRELLKEIDIGALKHTIFNEIIESKRPLDEAISLGDKGFRLEDDIDQLLDELSTSIGGIDALSRVIDAVYLIGRLAGEHPVKKSIQGAKGGAGNAAWWHEIAVSRAREIRKKHPDPEAYANFRIAGDVYAELKDTPDGPSSAGTVDAYLRRNLWEKGVRPTRKRRTNGVRPTK